MLLLCITGLPLIFHHEIDDFLHSEVKPADVPPGTPGADLDRLLANALANSSLKVPHFLIWDRDDPNAMFVSVGEFIITPDPTKNCFVRMDSHTGAYLDSPDVTGRFTYIMLRLHIDMFAGLAGQAVPWIDGDTLSVSPSYPASSSMRRRCGSWISAPIAATARASCAGSTSTIWPGILLVMWTLVVGFTGVINTWADLVLKAWQYGQLAEMTAQYRDRPPPTNLTSVQAAVDVAARAVPGMTPSFVAFPGTVFSSKSHYIVFLKGDTPVTSRLLKPALIDAETGKLTDSRDMPWYVTTLFISQPLHFGDYGGMPLKILWAVLDVLTIIVLGTGVYLWLRRRRAGVSVERAIARGSAVNAPMMSS